LRLIADFALAEELPVMMHAAESLAEDQLLREGRGLFASGLAMRGIQWRTPGLSPIRYLQETGVLDTRPLLAHCIRVDDEDIEIIAQSGAGVAHCPKSNAKLGHGRAPLGKFLAHNIRVGLGTDSVASNNSGDLIEEARFASLLARLEEQGRVDAATALTAATVGGARALKMEEQIGDLHEGKQADLAIVRFGATHQLPSYDPVSTLIFSSSGRDVIQTVVAGKEVFRDGRVTTVDEERLRFRMIEIASKLSQ
jgi:5-methylthioadenosine/S-adenosylhomocysteine deaminase